MRGLLVGKLLGRVTAEPQARHRWRARQDQHHRTGAHRQRGPLKARVMRLAMRVSKERGHRGSTTGADALAALRSHMFCHHSRTTSKQTTAGKPR